MLIQIERHYSIRLNTYQCRCVSLLHQIIMTLIYRQHDRGQRRGRDRAVTSSPHLYFRITLTVSLPASMPAVPCEPFLILVFLSDRHYIQLGALILLRLFRSFVFVVPLVFSFFPSALLSLSSPLLDLPPGVFPFCSPFVSLSNSRSVEESSYDRGRGVFDRTEKEAQMCVRRPAIPAVRLYLVQNDV